MKALKSALADIAHLDSDIKAWSHLSTDCAPSRSPTPAGPLDGLLFGVKDVIDVQGMPTRFGASLGPKPPASRDASCVVQLRSAGALPIGKTVTAEFAYAAAGPTRNPHNREHTPGGSSSGSAAAVAAGMVPMALGTQTGGSIIRPSAFSGVVGFKPSFGLVHRGGMLVLCDTLDTIGWFARDVALAQQVAAVFMDTEPLQAVPSLDRLRVAVLPCESAGPLQACARDTLRQAAEAVAREGGHVQWFDHDDEVAALGQAHAGIMRYELSRGLLPFLRAEPGALRAPTRKIIDEGLQLTPREYMALSRSRTELQQKWRDRYASYDLILTPGAPGEAPMGLESTGSSAFNRIWSLLGWPCIQLPCAMSAGGLPLGVQCVGGPGQDARLLALARRLHPLLDRRPAGLGPGR